MSRDAEVDLVKRSTTIVISTAAFPTDLFPDRRPI